MFLDVQKGFGPGSSLKNGEALHLERPAEEQADVAVVVYNHSTELIPVNRT